MRRLFPFVSLGLGACLSFGLFLEYLVEVPEEELAYELSSGGVGALLLFSPYVGLAVLGRRARQVIGYGALALLLLASGPFLAPATSDGRAA